MSTTATTNPVATRRLMACDTFDRVIDDVSVLRQRGYTRAGTWSLPQVCRHLAVAIECALSGPTDTPATPEQAEVWRRFTEVVYTTGMPAGRPLPSNAVDPPADCADADVDRFVAAARALAAHPGPMVATSRFGPIPIDEARRFHLAHTNHHLSFLRPATARRTGLEYPDVAAALVEVAELRKGYVRTGSWNLAQIAQHVAGSLRNLMRSGDFPPDSAEQVARRPLLERMLATNEIPSGLTAPPAASPPADLTDESPEGVAAIDSLVAELKHLQSFPGPFAPHRLFGRLTNDQAVRHQLVHAAHHLSHLVPVKLPMTKTQNPMRSQ